MHALKFLPSYQSLQWRSVSLRLLVPAILALYGVTWLWHLNSVSLVVPMDNIEQLVWVRSLEWGYFKHPPLPTWLLWIFVKPFGLHGVTTTLLGATITLTSICIMCAVAYRAGGRAFTLIALLATLCVTFYNGRLDYYNHNVVQMLWVSLSAWIFLQILLLQQLRWWLALGVVAGAAMLTKYQYALLVVPMFTLYARYQLWKQPQHRKGLLLALAVSMIIVSPHLFWLKQQVRGPLEYAMSSSFQEQMTIFMRIFATLNWSADWLLNRCMPALILIAIVKRGLRPLNADARASFIAGNEAQAARAIVWHWGVYPLLLMVMLGLFAGMDLQLHWGTSFALWTVPAAMLLFRLDTGAEPDDRMWRWLVLPFVLLQAALLILSYETSFYGRFAKSTRTWRQFPATEIAQELSSAASAELRQPLRVLVGNENICGAIALALPQNPKVLIEGDPAINPWITPQDLASPATVWIWKERDAPPDSHPLHYGLRWSLSGT